MMLLRPVSTTSRFSSSAAVTPGSAVPFSFSMECVGIALTASPKGKRKKVSCFLSLLLLAHQFSTVAALMTTGELVKDFKWRCPELKENKLINSISYSEGKKKLSYSSG